MLCLLEDFNSEINFMNIHFFYLRSLNNKALILLKDNISGKGDQNFFNYGSLSFPKDNSSLNLIETV